MFNSFSIFLSSIQREGDPSLTADVHFLQSSIMNSHGHGKLVHLIFGI